MFKIGEILDALNYDFSQFELMDFISAIRQYRNRDIILLASFLTLERGLDSFWTPKETADYILYNPAQLEFARQHGILHELGHIVLGHPPTPFEEIISQIDNPTTHMPPVMPGIPGILPDVSYLFQNDPYNAEADAFAAEVQIRYNRSQQTFVNDADISSIPGIANSFDGMAFDE